MYESCFKSCKMGAEGGFKSFNLSLNIHRRSCIRDNVNNINRICLVFECVILYSVFVDFKMHKSGLREFSWNVAMINSCINKKTN